MPQTRPSSWGWVAAFLVLFIWSGWIVVSRLGVTQSLTVFDITALRFLVASVAVAPLVWRHWPRRLAWWKVVLLSCGPGVPYILFALLGMTYAPASHAGILMNGTLPILAAVIAWLWLRDKPTRRGLLGMAIILGATLLIAWDRQSAGVGADAWIGQLCFLASAGMLAAYMTATKVWQVTPAQALAFIPLVNLAWFGPLYLLFLPKNIEQADWSEILLQGLYQGLGPGVLGVVGFTMAVRSIGATSTAAVMAAVPAAATILAIPVLGEWPSLFAWAGLALASAGILLTAGWPPGWRRMPVSSKDLDLPKAG